MSFENKKHPKLKRLSSTNLGDAVYEEFEKLLDIVEEAKNREQGILPSIPVIDMLDLLYSQIVEFYDNFARQFEDVIEELVEIAQDDAKYVAEGNIEQLGQDLEDLLDETKDELLKSIERAIKGMEDAFYD